MKETEEEKEGGKVEKRREGKTNIYIHTYMNSYIWRDYSKSDFSIDDQ